MGGVNTNQQVPEDPALQTPEQKAALEANYERLRKQGMSDQGIVSWPELKKEVVDTGKELGAAIDKKIVKPLEEKIPNFFGRDASKPTAASESAIDAGLGK
jgi:hypothetical protein